jgi:hypothetical protein
VVDDIPVVVGVATLPLLDPFVVAAFVAVLTAAKLLNKRTQAADREPFPSPGQHD